VEATTLSVSYGTYSKTFTLALDADKKTAAVDVSNRPIYQDSISDTLSGLTPATLGNFVIHATSDHTDKDLVSQGVSTLAFSAPVLTMTTSKPLDTSYVYTYSFQYVEETAVVVDFNGDQTETTPSSSIRITRPIKPIPPVSGFTLARSVPRSPD
jgi:hypothetical protein